MSHPRERFDLVADVGAEAAFLDAWNRDRLHHGWLLTGVEGVGKASFAYRAARRLLGAEPDAARGPLGAAPYDPVSRLVAGRAHPDLLVLERAEEGGRLRRTISVDQARALPEFFAKSPSQARFRVAIIDAADDLNLNAANALLKVLEEPPERGVLFLVCHAPGRLLATIRSRCRRLAFPRWPEVELAALVERRTGLDRDAADRIAALAAGSPGQALALASGPMLELDAVAERWVAEGLTLAEQVA
ncbi:MAG: DNA polymerase III subunit delta', partial [Caulobacter sp.]